jgi:hypothetical protein
MKVSSVRFRLSQTQHEPCVIWDARGQVQSRKRESNRSPRGDTGGTKFAEVGLHAPVSHNSRTLDRHSHGTGAAEGGSSIDVWLYSRQIGSDGNGNTAGGDVNGRRAVPERSRSEHRSHRNGSPSGYGCEPSEGGGCLRPEGHSGGSAQPSRVLRQEHPRGARTETEGSDLWCRVALS